MTDEQREAILAEVKAKMNLPTGDTSYDAQITRDIAEGAAILAKDLGIEDPDSFDWTDPGRSRSLLVNWCYYAENDASEQFHGDFAHIILAERDSNLTAQWEEANSDEE